MELYQQFGPSHSGNESLNVSDFAKDSHVRLWIKAENTINPVLEQGTIKEINWKTGKIKIFNDTNKKTISVDLKKTHSFNEKPFHFDDFVKNDLEGLFIASAPSILSTHIFLPNEPMAKISVLNVGISPDKNLIVTGNKKFIDKFNTLCDTLNDLKVIVDTTSTTDDALHTLICEHAQLDPETEMILQSVIMHSDDLPLESHDEAAELNEGTVEQQEVDIIDEEAEDTEEEISAGETLPYGCSKPYALDIHIYHPLKNSEINRRHITLKGNAPANTRIWLCHNGWKEKKIHFFALTTSDSEGKWKASLTVKNGDHKIAAKYNKGKSNVCTWGHDFKVVSLWLKYYPKQDSEAGFRIAEYRYSAFEPPKNDEGVWVEVRGHIPLHLRNNLYYHPLADSLTTSRLNGTLTVSRYKRQANPEIPLHAVYTEADFQKINDKITTVSEMDFIGTLYSSFNWAKAAYVAAEALKNPVGVFATLITLPFTSNRESVAIAYNIGTSIGFILQILLMRAPVVGPVVAGLAMAGTVIQEVIKVTEQGTITHDNLLDISNIMKDFIDLGNLATPKYGNLIDEKKLIENTTIDSRGSRDFIITPKPLTPLYGNFSHEAKIVADDLELRGITYQGGGYYRNLTTNKDYIYVDGRWVRINGFRKNGSPVPADKNGTSVTNLPTDIVKDSNGNWTVLKLRGGVGERTIPLYQDIRSGYNPEPQLSYDPNYVGQGAIRLKLPITFEEADNSALPIAIGADARLPSDPRWMGNDREPGILLFETRRFMVDSPRNNTLHDFINVTPTSTERASDNNKLISAYWVPQNRHYDIPIHPTGTEPTTLFTDNFSGCSFVVDQINDTHYRVYHVFSKKENEQYNLLEEHGKGQVAYIPHTEYSFLHRPTADSLHPSQDACGFISMRYKKYPNEAQGNWVITVRSQSLPVQITASGYHGQFNGAPPRLNMHTPITVRPI
ncbi:hypothetical protein MBA34_25860 [Pseudomonas capeferrum]|uniref:hypothetical protein n=1 Tax=Pseudomonas capeferrum TaxID=1495066 RepID=UPI000A9C80EA|nr:hypothetical protein [Pseudomonas capeferrum]MCH7302437.1 hypothetical protein [Pseudomonas capeferrum]